MTDTTSLPNEYSWIKSRCLRIIFGRFRSFLNGIIMKIYVPTFLRNIVLTSFAALVRINLDEAEKDLKEYSSISALFSRNLKYGVRTCESIDPAAIVSPVDCKLVVASRADSNSDESCLRAPQVKGTEYCLRTFLGLNELKIPEDKTLWTLVLYLSPADYHHFHCPTKYKILGRSHFEGEMYPISPLLAKRFNNLFCLQERVVLRGMWEGGQMHYAAVAAYNVGDIRITFDKECRTNRRGKGIRKRILPKLRNNPTSANGTELDQSHMQHSCMSDTADPAHYGTSLGFEDCNTRELHSGAGANTGSKEAPLLNDSAPIKATDHYGNRIFERMYTTTPSRSNITTKSDVKSCPIDSINVGMTQRKIQNQKDADSDDSSPLLGELDDEQFDQYVKEDTMVERSYEHGIYRHHMDEIGEFRMGSTIVLVFEASKDFKLKVEVGDALKVGQLIGA